jgi:hypothetical protein
MYVAAMGATCIVLIILAGEKPLERRFISAKQERNIHLLAERGSVLFDSVRNVLGTGSVRVKQFIVQQSEDDPGLDSVQIGLSGERYRIRDDPHAACRNVVVRRAGLEIESSAGDTTAAGFRVQALNSAHVKGRTPAPSYQGAFGSG